MIGDTQCEKLELILIVSFLPQPSPTNHIHWHTLALAPLAARGVTGF